MKKTLLAAALTVGFAGVAQAETQVTLYGLIDVGVGYNKIENGDVDSKKFGLVNGVQSGSRFGLRGTEDLGNGLQAVFQLEHGFDSSTGYGQQGGRQFGRHATLGLQSDAWGRLDFGRQTNIASKYLGDSGIASPFATSFGQANVGATLGAANTNRWDNMIMYQTPNFSGFQFGVGYSFNVDGSQDWDTDDVYEANVKGITAGLRYANGPIGVALTYDQIKRDGRAATPFVAGPDFDINDPSTWGDVTPASPAITSTKVQAWNVGGSYDFEIVKLHLGFGQSKDGLIGAHNFGPGFSGGNIWRDGMDSNLYTVGLSAPVGAGRVMASWGMVDTDDHDGIEYEKQNIYSLGYTYPLSKRTNIYAVGSYAKNLHGIDDTKSTAVAVGLRHQF